MWRFSSRLPLSSRGVPVRLPGRLRTFNHLYRFHPLIYGSAFDFASAYVVFQPSVDVDWMQYDNDDRWFYYMTELGPFHDVPREVVKIRERDSNGNIVTRPAFPLHQVLWAVTAERRVMLDEEEALMQVEEDEHEEDVPPPEEIIKDVLAVGVEEEDGWDLCDVPPPDVIDFHTSFPVNL